MFAKPKNHMQKAMHNKEKLTFSGDFDFFNKTKKATNAKQAAKAKDKGIKAEKTA
jgi:hypothetical protein